MSGNQDHKLSMSRSRPAVWHGPNFPGETHVSGDKIVRSLPFRIQEDVRLYEIKTTSRGSYTRPRRENADAARHRA